MRMYRFDPDTGQALTEHGSHDVGISRIAPRVTVSGIVVMHVWAGGVIGRHPAAQNQLFMVVAGSGWVSGGDDARKPIKEGEAAFWVADEEHESGSDTGMTALVLEGPGINPDGVMVALSPNV